VIFEVITAETMKWIMAEVYRCLGEMHYCHLLSRLASWAKQEQTDTTSRLNSLTYWKTMLFKHEGDKLKPGYCRSVIKREWVTFLVPRRMSIRNVHCLSSGTNISATSVKVAVSETVASESQMELDTKTY
jgi:hypothetical protein